MFVALRKKTFFNLMRRQYLQILANARIGGLFRIRPPNFALSGTKKNRHLQTDLAYPRQQWMCPLSTKKTENGQYEILFTAPISGTVLFYYPLESVPLLTELPGKH